MTRGEIWICGDLRTPRHWKESQKVLAKAHPLAHKAGVPISLVLMGASKPDNTGAQSQLDIDLSACVDLDAAAQQAVSMGVHRIYCLDHAHLAVPRTDTYARVLAEFVMQRKPWLVLVSLNDFGRETAAFCAQRCQAGLIADCTELGFEDNQFIGHCPAWGGEILADIVLADGWPTAFVTVQPHGEGPQQPEPQTQTPAGRIETIAIDEIPAPEGLELRQRALEEADGRRLEDAEIVVAGGAGLGDIRGFGQVRELAAALGGEVGATRPPVLYHWVDEEQLIGQTGKTIRPKLLISAGTSGAIQYTAGIMESETIVAINSDPAAPIFQVADVGIVADAGAFLPLLTDRAKQAAMRKLADAACALSDSEVEGGPKGRFGALVRQLREARNWTADDLAQATGQTPEFIDQVESDQLSPPVSFILRMAQAMQVDPGTFLRKEERAAIRDRRAQAYYQRTQQYSYKTLTPGAENSHLRAFMITIEPHHAHKPVAYKHEGEEFIFVMEGDLELTLGSKVRKLKPGESIHFNSDVPHKLKSLSNDPTRCLVVLYTI